MRCDNPVKYHIPRGYSYRSIEVKCGSTDPFGDRAICGSCGKDREVMQQIRNHELMIEEDNAWMASAGWGEI